ncbi:hypothetical protein EMIHUDRAFT_230039 [Emiliania huxleyi CCMP1516]|uniref:Uncharacterized protein n=2 Tax=Emiliania huxleyi TaxID=2903 RepID=A0A0D3JKG8_EMIH1|nr:hypothetical protein EMIHUDRAFT_207036 [Emiliania huxleyi CCMP1516]XP_005785483.1 hypothetical protein EMIHUDRAFT_230039 [Emiliania huxleyi CCMP1516]EOD24003.1 hypothetical protein EMIHUDRAFT_207036 [Emiliania huxleyi CCMP1516]EOD33054.1 hypothetical protein EMIHUDRAFT_230039 [Emiliania huxleyi CCMP1516]|eukprot:XP_005776432.1 hypothetical protein EMIHUDRAFT_207036 [Emiliania huxleyi CCMP1516]
MESASFKDLLVVKTGVKVWSTVAATLFSLLLAAGLVESHIRPSALLPTALVGLYAVYSERQDVLGAATFLLWWSYISDALWFAIGPLGLDAASRSVQLGGLTVASPDGDSLLCVAREAPSGLSMSGDHNTNQHKIVQQS